MKTILVHLNGRAADSTSLDTALCVARMFTAHLTCLRVLVDPAVLYAQAASADLGISMLMPEMLDSLEKQDKERTAHAREALSALEQREHIVSADRPLGPDAVSFSWRETVGEEVDEIIAHARFHDLVVLAGGPERAGRLSAEELGNIVIGSGRPVLLTGTRAPTRTIKTICVAWKNTPESARAITASMGLLEKADRVHVLSADEGDGRAKEGLHSADSIVGQLRWHGLNASSDLVTPGKQAVADAVLESAHGKGADLLIMGAYGHSRVREFVFGGFTRRVLEGVHIPVLVFH